MQVNAADTVDCTHMDTAISLTFNRPQPFTDISAAAPGRPGVDFENQNSKLLKGFNLNPFTLGQFTMDNVNGMSYGAYLTYITSQAAVKSNRVSFATSLSKSY